MSGTLTQSAPADRPTRRGSPTARIESVDALRGLVMFTMIFVNDLARAQHVPAWMKHFTGKNGMTFVDLVFPAFLFIVGMSIPLAIGPRRAKGQPFYLALGHVLLRTLALLTIGILMMNTQMPRGYAISYSSLGWSPRMWTALMYISSILTFCSIRIGGKNVPEEKIIFWRRVTWIVRAAGLALMVLLVLTYRSENDKRLLQFHPFVIRHVWYGILGVIGWAYLIAALIYLVFGNRRTALLGCTALVMCLYPAGKLGMFADTWIASQVNIAGTLGSHAAIAVAGLLIGSILVTPQMASHGARIGFTLLFVAGFALAAVLLDRPWGVSKEEATPAWCFWACAITAALWLVLYLIVDVLRGNIVLRPLSIAGQNVLLAYLLSEMNESLNKAQWYRRLSEPNLQHAILRSASCAAIILLLTALLNRVGFKLKI